MNHSFFYPDNQTNDSATQEYTLITGASRGIGRAAAEKFAAEGRPLILCCKSLFPELCGYAKSLCETRSIPILCFQTDVSNPEAVNGLFSALEEQKICISILVNNAGISRLGLLSEMSVEEWNRVLATNLSSVFYFSRKVIPDMVRRQNGKIINISSVWGLVGASCEVAYSASKGGINAFTKALAKELAPSNIQVNAIACGVIDTDMNKHLSMSDLEILKGEIPADRIGTAIEVAKMVHHVIEAPSYLTGQIISLDGGWQ